MTLPRMSLGEHLGELRRRLWICVCAWGAAGIFVYLYAQPVFDFLAAPLAHVWGPGHQLIYTDLTQGFFTHFRIGLWGGFALAFPVMAFQGWRFVAPGLYKTEKSVFLGTTCLSLLLFGGGIALAYYGVLPWAWSFFLSFEVPSANALAGEIPIILQARIDEYLSLVLQILLAFGLCFQLPLVLVAAVRLKILDKRSLKHYRRHAIVAIFVVAAVMTPPDIISQICLALPLIVLYEGAIWLAYLLDKEPPHA